MGRFVGIGVGSYEQGHRALPCAVSDVEAFAALLGDGFTREVLANPDEFEVLTRLRALRGALPEAGPLVLLWAGHGIGESGLWLLARDSDPPPVAGLGAAQVARLCAVSGANQLLLILDTCYSRGGLSAAEAAAKAS